MRQDLRLASAVVATLCLLFLTASVAHAATFTVTNTADSGAGSLRDAINQANAATGADTIEFQIPANDAGCAGGVCAITLTSGELVINSDLTINGPGASKLTIRRSDAGVRSRIFTVKAIVATLYGLTLSHGYPADSDEPFGRGGAVFTLASQLTVADCVISDSIGSQGGGIYNVGRLLNIINSTLSGNQSGYGGAILSEFSGQVNISHSVVSNNKATGSGGTIVGREGVSMDVNDSIISDNSSGGGGSLRVYYSSLTIRNSTISNNSGGGVGGYAGFVSISRSIISGNTDDPAVDTSSNMTISDSTISNNSGGPYSSAAVVGYGFKMVNSTVSNNEGNGIASNNDGGPITLSNCTISGNQGWGVYPSTGFTISNSTITRNKSGGVYVPRPAFLLNTIVADNTGPNFDIYPSATLTSLGHNLDSDGTSGLTNGVNGDIVGTSTAPINPLLGPLQDNGGPTFTHALLSGSPAINAGDNCVVEAAHCGNDQIQTLNFDQRGLPRLAGSAVDIGAFEFQSTNPLDTPQFFVRQQYLDFLNREPDGAGLNYWTSQIKQCGTDAACVNRKRVDVGAAFFIEQEFQQTGFFIYRLYKAAYGARPTYSQFAHDRARITGGENLEASKAALTDEFVRRAEFQSVYPDAMSNADFVNKLFDTASLRPYVAERQARIVALQTHTETRSQVLRDVTEFAEFRQREYNPSFVLMQYFGYLRRDADEEGYNFWLNVLNNAEPNNYRGMVCSFITSEEYQQRFSPIVTHSNTECGQ